VNNRSIPNRELRLELEVNKEHAMELCMFDNEGFQFLEASFCTPCKCHRRHKVAASPFGLVKCHSLDL